MTVHGDGLRDKRPTFLKVYTTEYDHFRTIPKGTRAYAMAVYMCVASHAHGNKDTAFPSHALICEATGLSKPTVIKALAALAASGHLLITQRSNDKGFQTSNLYSLLSTPGVNDVDTLRAAHQAEDAGVNDIDAGGKRRLRRGSATFTAGVNDVDTNQINESDEMNEIKERDTRASRAAASGVPSPTPPMPLSETEGFRRAREQSERNREDRRRARLR